MSSYRGKFEKGKIIFTGDVPPLKDGDPVVVVTEGTHAPINGSPDPADPFDTIGDDAVDTGVTDMSVEHDHYIYGTPKRNQRKES